MPVRVALVVSCLVFLVVAGRAEAAQCPNAMLVLDASGSMLQDAAGHWPEDPEFQAPSKWAMLRDCVNALLDQWGDRVPFGLMVYSGGGSDDATCASDCSVQVAVSHTSKAAIRDMLNKIVPQRDAQTPTNGAIHAARLDPALRVAGLQQNIILVTDGDPNCGSDRTYADLVTHEIDPDVTSHPGTVLGELDKAYRQSPSIRTFVVGFFGDSSSVNTLNLENMGYYGGNRQAGCGSGDTHCYFPVAVGGATCSAILDAVASQVVGESSRDCENTCEGGICPPGEACVKTESEPTAHCAPTSPCVGDDCGGSAAAGGGGCQCRTAASREGSGSQGLLEGAALALLLVVSRRRVGRAASRG